MRAPLSQFRDDRGLAQPLWKNGQMQRRYNVGIVLVLRRCTHMCTDFVHLHETQFKTGFVRHHVHAPRGFPNKGHIDGFDTG